ncbi:MAG TPA: hypothetical protein VGM39_11190 [Kofleriaceae bacterium]
MRASIAAVLLAGCLTEHTVVVDGPTLHQSAPDLEAHGVATVDADEVRVSDGDYTEHTAWRERVAIDQEVTDKLGRTRWVRDLLRGCSATDFSAAANPDCELETPAAEYKTRTWETRNTTMFLQIALAGTTVGALGAAGICLDKCDDDSGWHHASAYTLGIAGTALVGTLIWAILDCSGKWGEPGCRD